MIQQLFLLNYQNLQLYLKHSKSKRITFQTEKFGIFILLLEEGLPKAKSKIKPLQLNCETIQEDQSMSNPKQKLFACMVNWSRVQPFGHSRRLFLHVSGNA